MSAQRTVSDREVQQFIGTAAQRVAAKNPKTSVTASVGSNMLQSESGGPNRKTGMWSIRTSSRGAEGLSQMFPDAVSDAHYFLTGERLQGAALRTQWKRVTDDPEQSVLYGMAYLAACERIILGWGITKSIRDPNHIATVVQAAHHFGPGPEVRAMLDAAMVGGAFSIEKFVDAYEQESIRQEGHASARCRVQSRIGGTPPKGTGVPAGQEAAKPPQIVRTGPTEANADTNRAIPLSFSAADAVPITPLQLIEEGLDIAAWSDGDPLLPGKLTANPRLRSNAPAWFELRLNRQDGQSLSNPTTGSVIRVVLNVSLANLTVRSQHVVNREPTATGLLISFWGSQPDTITGRGTTGAFINQTGLTAIMSNRLTPKASGWWETIQKAYGQRDSVQKVQGQEDRLLVNHDLTRSRAGLNLGQMSKMWGLDGNGQNRFRVAAQDAFAELLLLFKNNGVTRFLPLSWIESQTNQKALREAVKKPEAWSPSAGATGFQMLNRAGDVHSRGHVVFKYRGATYLGYFKAFNFSASADKPFQWDFDFTFRVLKSLNPHYVHKLGGA